MKEVVESAAVLTPPYKSGELYFLDNSFPSVIEIVSVPKGKEDEADAEGVRVAGKFAGDRVNMIPGTVYRPLNGPDVGKLFTVRKDASVTASEDPHPPANVSRYTPTGHREATNIAQSAIDFLKKEKQWAEVPVSTGSLASDIAALDTMIQAFQASPGTLKEADQKALTAIAAASKALAAKAKA